MRHIQLTNPAPWAINNSTAGFGYSLAFCGETLAVSAPRDKTMGEVAGAVHLYDANPNSNDYGRLARTLYPLRRTPANDPPLPDHLANDSWFGSSIAAHDNLIAISAIGKAGWPFIRLFVGDIADPQCGSHVADLTFDEPVEILSLAFSHSGILSAATLARTTGNTVVAWFVRIGNAGITKWFPWTRDEIRLDTQCTIAGANGRALVGTPTEGKGRVRVYDGRAVAAAEEYYVGTLQPEGLAPGDRFGSSVLALERRCMVSAPNLDGSGQHPGRVFVFDSSQAWPWPLMQVIDPSYPSQEFGACLAGRGRWFAVRQRFGRSGVVGVDLSTPHEGRVSVYDADTGALVDSWKPSASLGGGSVKQWMAASEQVLATSEPQEGAGAVHLFSDFA